ncbi:MAG: EAL domain-containing protein [Tissierellia bacterium]|nr:EAL domain-containing protein [Tissierellia bacterium]
MRLDNRIDERVNPQKEALIISIIYLVLGSMFTSLYDSRFFIAISTVLIYFIIYDRVKRIKKMNAVVYESLEELSEATKGLVETQEKLYMEKMLSDNIIKNSSLVIFTWDLDYKILSFNPYAERVTGYKEEEVIGKSWVDLFLHDDEKPKVEGLTRYLKSGKPLKNSIGDVWRTKDGRNIELIWTDSPIVDENNDVVKIISIGTDITDHKNLVKRLNKIAYYDGLTGLPNRSLLEKEAEKIIERARSKDEKLAFLYVDIDDFKQINDTLGYSAGDKLLIHIGQVLKSNEKNNYYLSKLGEDEYSIILTGVKDKEDVIERTERILNAIRQPWCTDNYEFNISASIGISLFPDNGDNFYDLMKYGNMAMFHVKQRGKNGYFFYQDELGERISYNTFIINHIRRAIEEEEFKLQYQPIINLITGELYGFESLLRWYNPERGYISPMEYIPLIEETGQIVDVTFHVLKMAIKQKKLWQDMGFKGFVLGVNISNKSLMKCGIDEELKMILREYDVDPKELVLEITETVFADNIDYCIDSLFGVRELGIRMALDDFGTGYSSLAQLKRLPINYIKIDKSFIKNLSRTTEDKIIVRTIINMAHNLGLYVIAEGIETKAQRDVLIELGCDYGQGFYFAEPLDPVDVEATYFVKVEKNA